MSIENLKEYARRCAVDPDLRRQAKAIGLTNIDGQIAHAGSLGLDWTNNDFDAFRKQMQAEGELADEELENVAGGLISTTVSIVMASTLASTSSASGGGGW